MAGRSVIRLAVVVCSVVALGSYRPHDLIRADVPRIVTDIPLIVR